MRAWPVRKRRAAGPRVLIAATFATAVSSNLGFALGVLGPALRLDLGISRTALGALSAAFFASTGCASIAAARLVRRFGTRASAFGALAFSGAGCTAAVTLGNYAAVLAASVVGGAGYAAVNVATNRIVRSVSDHAHLGRHMAIKTSGVPVATTTVGVVGGVTAQWGWRPAIALLATFIAMSAAVTLRTFRDAPAPALRSHDPNEPLPATVYLLGAAGFCAIAGSQPIYTWFVVYVHEALGFASGTASLIGGLCTAGGIPAMVLVAHASDRLGAGHRARFIGWLCATTGVTLILVLVGQYLGSGLAIVGVVIGAAANLSVAGLFPALITECAPHAIERGTGVAMTGYFAGALVSPVGFGAIADATGGYAVSWSVAAVAMVLATAMFLRIGRLGSRAGDLVNGDTTASPEFGGVAGGPVI